MKHKNVLLGITASIATYKTCDLINLLKGEGYNVKAIMTYNACKLIKPLTIQSLTGNIVHTEMFENNFSEIEHISIAKWCDVLAIVPATANIIGKIASGIADDLLSTVTIALSQDTPVIIAPAMNTNMWENKFVQNNIQNFEALTVKKGNSSIAKYTIIGPRKGSLACGDEGMGALAKIEDIFYKIKELSNL